MEKGISEATLFVTHYIKQEQSYIDSYVRECLEKQYYEFMSEQKV